ncbi:VCBS domain-containing protein, partial [Uliginosibacterium paludis]
DAPVLGTVTNATIAEVDQSSSTTDTGLTGTLSGSDVDVETLTYGISGGTVSGTTVTLVGTYGTLTLNTATGVYSYAKNSSAIEALDSGETGTDAFTFTVSDGDGALVTRPFTVTVTGADDAPVLAAVTNATIKEVDQSSSTTDTGLSGTLSGSDVDVETLTYGISGGTVSGTTVTLVGSYGTLTLNTATGSYSYAKNSSAIEALDSGETGTDAFTFTVSDGDGALVTRPFTVTVTGADDAPVLAAVTNATIKEVDQSSSTTDTGLSGTLSGSDVDVKTLTYGISGGTVSGTTVTLVGSYGTLTLNTATGAYSYAKNSSAIEALDSGETGTDAFTFTVSDGDGALVTRPFTVTVTGADDAPVLSAVTNATIKEIAQSNSTTDTGLTGTLSATDVDVETLTYGISGGTVSGTTVTKTGTYGTLTLNTTTGAYTYTKNTSAIEALDGTQSGVDSFTFTVTDGDGALVTQSYSVTVTGGDDAPVNTMPASYTTKEDTSLALTGLSVSDVDAGSATITVTLVVNNGVLSISGGNASISGSGSNVVTLTGTVAQINSTLAASVTYQPDGNYNGTDKLTMTSSDGRNSGSSTTLSDSDSIAITVTPVNDAPVNTLPTSWSTTEDTSVKLSGLSVTDVDAASGPMSITLSVTSGSIAASSTSAVSVSGSGSSTVTLTGTLASLNAYLAASSTVPVYTPASNATADVTLTMTTNDNGNTGGTALTDTDTRTITITPVNDAAMLTADSATTNEDTTVSGNVLSNDTDVDSTLTVGSFTWNGTTYSAGATATISGVGSLRIGSNGAYTFTPASNYNGSVPTATYSVLEDGSASASSTLSLGITPVNDAPVNTVKTFSTSAPTTGMTYISLGGMSVTDVDAGSSTITVTFKISSTYGTLAATGSTSYGVTSSTSTTSGVQTLTLTGTLTAINTYLALTTGTSSTGNGLSFSTTSGSTTGTADLTMTSSDGSLTDTDVTTITIAETSTTGNADPDTGTLTEDATSALTGNVLTNDQGGTKSVSLVSFEGVTQTVGTAFSTNYGTLTITSTGAYTYTVNNSAVQYLAAGQSITETVVYRETYNGGTDTSTLTITITGANDAPVISATSVAVTGTEDTSYVFSWSQFGITDVDTSNTLYVQVTTLPSDGTLQYYNGSAWVSVTAGQNISKSDIDSGYFRFVPDSNESGADIYGTSGTGNMKNDYASFTFKGYDGTTTSSATGTVTIDITPVADDAKLTVGGVSVIDGSTLIVTPPDSNGLTVRQYTSIGNISTTTVDTLAEVQSLLTLLDANTASSTTISTTPQNYTANTNSDPSGIPTDGATRITGLIYLEAGHTYTFSSYMDDTALLVVGGTVLMAKQYNSWGNITATSYTVTVSGYYTIDWAVYNGNSIGAFKPYLSVDGGTAKELTSSNFLIYSSLAAVEAAGGVHDAVVGTSTAGYYPVSNSGVEDTAISISPITISLSDSDGSESLVSLLATDLLVGTVLTDGTNTFTATSGSTSVNITSWNLSTLKITPPVNFYGNYSLDLTLTSKENATGELATNSTTLTIPVANVQDAPVSANDTASVVEDSGSYVVSGNVMSNDSDPDGDAITVTAVNRQSALLGTDVAGLYGYFHINADGSYTYTLTNDNAQVNALNSSQTLTDTVSYTIADANGGTSTSTLTVTIVGTADTYATSNSITGTLGDDSLTGTSSADLIQSLAGSDYVEAGAGNDVVQTGDSGHSATQAELLASSFITTADASMTDSAGLLTVADSTNKGYGDLVNGGDGNDAIMASGSGSHLLYGGAGNDYLLGGSGSDALRGGAGNDRIEGGAGSDVLRGDLGADVFAWSLNDHASTAGTTAAVAGNIYGVAAGIQLSGTTDIVTDFSKADGDALDLRDLLSGESHLGLDTGNLNNYLHFETTTSNGVTSTVVHVSTTGGFTNGVYDASKENQTIVLQNVNLLTDGTSSLLNDNAVIQDMLNNKRLIVD